MIEVVNLTKEFDKNKIFENLSFSITDNEGLFLVGPSGCGKTTVLRIISGLDADYQGQISVDQTVMTGDFPPNKRDVGIVFQEPTLWQHMTVRANISFAMPKRNDEALIKVAERLEIRDILDKYPYAISGGQAKRVSLARALLSGKKNLLLDEPLANVDVRTKEIIMNFLKEDYLTDKCVIYVTHDRDELNMLPFRVLEM